MCHRRTRALCPAAEPAARGPGGGCGDHGRESRGQLVFPTFEYGINLVLIGLTQFGLFVFAVTPWLWADADRNAEDPEFGRAKRRQNN